MYPAILRDNAACNEAAATLFDATNGDLVLLALSYCQRCTVRKPCMEFVRPARSYFDGVVAGHLWRNGRRVEITEGWDAAIDLDDESPPDVRDLGERTVPGVPAGGVHGGPGLVPDGAEDGG